MLIEGDGGDNNLNGGAEDDTIRGLAGNDRLDGAGGADTLEGGEGNYTLVLDYGADSADGGAGDDVVELSTGWTYGTLIGGVGQDKLHLKADVTVSGVFAVLGLGFEQVENGVAVTGSYIYAHLSGAGTDDVLDFRGVAVVGSAGLRLYGGDGSDIVYGGASSTDILYGGTGLDVVDYSEATGGVTVSLNVQGVQVNTGGGTADDVREFEGVVGSAFNDVLTGRNTSAFVSSLSGGAGDDSLRGGNGQDLIDGGSGNDILDGDPDPGGTFLGGNFSPFGPDTVTYASALAAVTVTLASTIAQNTGGGGVDTLRYFENLTGSAHNDTLTGDARGNVLTGGLGDDVIAGGAGIDTLHGGAGYDLIDGGANDDTASYAASTVGVTFSYDAGQAVILTDEGDVPARRDRLTSIETLRGSEFSDVFLAGLPVTAVYGGGGDDSVYTDVLAFGGTGNDTFYGTTRALGEAGDDRVVLSGLPANFATLDGGDGLDTLDFSGAGVAVNIHTRNSFEQLIGTAFNDDLTASDFTVGARLQGGAGSDGLYGGSNGDWLRGGTGNDAIEGGGGVDTVDYGDRSGVNSVGLTLAEPGFTAVATIAFSGGEQDLVTNVENVTGGGSNDFLNGNSGDNTLRGLGGPDYLKGGGGSDVLDGGDGLDTVDHSLGATMGITVDLRISGAQLVSAQYGMDTFISIEQVFGTNFDDTLIGDGAANFFQGAGGYDAIDGGDGDDNIAFSSGVLDGGAGDDRVMVRAGSVHHGGQGTDTLVIFGAVSTAAFASQDGFERLAYNQGLPSSINGSAGDDTLDLSSFAADPTATGQLAAYLEGGADTYRGHKGSDSINGYAGADTLFGGDGVDYVSGGDDNDVLSGDLGDDFLHGGTGADMLAGGAGADNLNGFDGVDAASYAGATSAVTVQLALTAAQNTIGAGVDTLSGIENLLGSDHADRLTGDAAANTLHGGGGADVLDGAAGDDAMFGGAGNDGLRGSGGADHYDGGEGVDVVNFDKSNGVNVFLDGSGTNGASAVGDSFVNIENLIGSLTGPDFLVGNAAANRLTGNGGADRLWGRGGIDQLEGGAGLDQLMGGAGADILLGGADADRFIFDTRPLLASERDRIGDFLPGTDTLQIDASAFGGGLVAGGAVTLIANANPSSVGQATGVFLYDTDTGFLSWDRDGGGPEAAVLLVWLQGTPSPALTAGDFLVVA